MASFKEQFNELIQLTELYLLQEYKMDDRIKAAPENFSYFKQQAALRKKDPSRHERIAPASRQAPSSSSAQAAAAPPLPKTNPEFPKPPVKEMQRDIKPEPSPSKKIDLKPIEPAITLEKDPLKLEPMLPAKLRDFSELRHIIKEQVLHLKISEEIRTPKIIPAIDVIVLFLACTPAGETLLNNITKAINLQLAPAKLLEASSMELNREWEQFLNPSSLKLIVIPQSDLSQLPSLSKLCKNNSKGLLLINGIPALLIPDPEQLNNDPLLKQNVWNSLKKIFKS
jgi:hypothetical protein